MTNVKYHKGRQALVRGEIDWVDDDFKVALVDSASYTPNIATDQFLDDIPSAAIIGTSANLTGKTDTDGVCDAADTEIPGVVGPVSEYLIIYKDTGDDATSPLLIFMDQGTNLPFTPNGSAVQVIWDNGANKIFVG